MPDVFESRNITYPNIVPMKLNRTLLMVVLLLAIAGKGMAQVIFTETFGQTTVRQTSPYMPPGSYAWADPNGNSDQQEIENNYYAVIAPANIGDAWPVPAWWFWTGAEPTGNTWGGANNPSTPNGNADHTGDPNGAVLVVNAGSVLNGFYSRTATITKGNSYRLSFWVYLVNASSMISMQVKDPSTQTVIGSEMSAFLSTAGSWQQLTYDFQFPASCTGGNQVQVYLANGLSNNTGNDYYIDDIMLETLAGPAGNTLQCPAAPMLLASNDLTLAANANGKNVELFWTVGHVQDFKAYELERSYDGTGFGTIGAVTASAAGVSGRFGYADVPYNSFAAGVTGSIYYRVKAIRADGSFVYSEVVPVSFRDNGNNVIAWPQPAAPMSAVTIAWTNTGAAGVAIFDATGALVRKAADVKGGRYTAGGLKSGMYIITITGEQGRAVATRKIIVL